MEQAYNHQITKFGFYGFFKNLKFFEPVLLIYLYTNGLLAFHIGILYAVRETIIYLFEIPSGVFADRYGKKTELIICFIFYIISFILFALGSTFTHYLIAMIFFGFGEAFRSGTHKAMIMLYLDQHGTSDQKSKVYGTTRSYSMLGSALSSVLTIFLVLIIEDLTLLFLFAIIPYIIDILLVLSYPNSLNDRNESNFSFQTFVKENKESIVYAWKNRPVRSVLVRSSTYQAMFKILKDFIQLILVSIPITILIFTKYDADEHVRIYSAMMYAVIFLISALVTKNAYKLENQYTPSSITKAMWLGSGLASLLIGAFTNQLIIVFIGFIFLYIFLNIRKPFMVATFGNVTDPSKRASVLSIDSQLTSILIIICAPILGWMSDTISFSFTFLVVGFIMIFIYLVGLLKPIKTQ
jgi:MFS family permease